MTSLQIMKYAYYGILDTWSKEYDRHRKNPDNIITAYHYEQYSKDLETIKRLLLEEERKAQ